MEFDDEQLPSESSICNMQHSYANSVSTLSENIDIEKIFNAIDWQQSEQLLLNLTNKAQYSNIKSYIKGLIELNNKDKEQLSATLKIKDITKNPVLNKNYNSSFNQLNRLFLQNETLLLANLTKLLPLVNRGQSEQIVAIIIRRLEALRMLSNFQTRDFLFNLI